MLKKENIQTELEDFLLKLTSYRDFRYSFASAILTKKRVDEGSKLRLELLERTGPASKIITELTGIETFTIFRDNKEYSLNLWENAFKRSADKYTLKVLDKCVDTTRKAIGQLKYDIEHGVGDEQGKLITAEGEIPSIFISHGKESSALIKVEQFIRELGIEPLIVKDQANQDKTVDDKVDYYLEQADCVIILATGDDSFDGKLHPRQNVIHEIGLAQKTHAGKIIYLLEENTEFPSNIRPKVWEPFTQDNMEAAFQRIVIELRAMKILHSSKPEKD